MNTLFLLVAGALADVPASAAPEATAPEATAPDLVEDGAEQADEALLGALLLLLSEDTGAQGAVALGALGDPRVVAPLCHTVETRRATVAVAAAHALSAYPESLPALAGWLVRADLDLSVRLAAADAIGEMALPAGADAVLGALDQRGLPSELRAHLITLLGQVWPERAAEAGGLVAQNGTPWLVGGGAAALGYALAAAGHFGKSEVMVGVGGVTGAVGGGTLGLVLGRTAPMEAGDAAFVTTSGVMGGAGGVLLGSAVGPDMRSDAAWLGGLAGETAGFGLGYALRARQPGTVADALEASAVSGLTAMALGTGTRFFQRDLTRPDGNYDASYYEEEDRQQAHVRLAVGAGVLAGGVTGQILSPKVDLSRDDLGTVALASTWGAMLGGLVPLGHEFDRRGLAFTGLSVAALTGYGLAPVLEPGPDVTVGGFTGLGYGSMAGFGVARLANPESDELARGLTLGLGSAGLAAGAALAWKNPSPMNVDDVVFSGATAGWSLFQTAGWLQAVPRADARYDGLIALVPAVAGAGTAIASPALDVDFGASLAASSLGLWGVYFGLAAAEIGDREQQWTPVMIGSDIGLGLGILMESPLIGADPMVVGLADGGGVLGGAIAAVGASFVTNDADTILGSSIVGAVLGAGGGTATGFLLQRRGKTARVAGFDLPELPDLPGRWAVAPASFYDVDADAVAWGASLQVDGW